ncbi:hypothetical protein [Helicobacter pylori]|uniref:hypothetical protein n=1 Tax=Helicobacter pylori TaxID=210 RepID=UPI0031456DEF
MNDHRAKALEIDNRLNEHQFKWLMKATPSAKASVSVDNNAIKTPITPTTTQNALNTPKQSTPNAPITKPKPASMEEIKNYINSNPFFRY